MSDTSFAMPAFLRNAPMPAIKPLPKHAFVCEVSGDSVKAVADQLRSLASSLERDQFRGAYIRSPSNIAASCAYRDDRSMRSDDFFQSIQDCIRRISLSAPCYREADRVPAASHIPCGFHLVGDRDASSPIDSGHPTAAIGPTSRRLLPWLAVLRHFRAWFGKTSPDTDSRKSR
jgi:hypothetical protein